MKVEFIGFRNFCIAQFPFLKMETATTELGQFTKLSVLIINCWRVRKFTCLVEIIWFVPTEQRLRATDSGFELLVPKPYLAENPSHLNGLLRIGGTEKSYRYYRLMFL